MKIINKNNKTTFHYRENCKIIRVSSEMITDYEGVARGGRGGIKSQFGQRLRRQIGLR
jgi:hypothetical protein